MPSERAGHLLFLLRKQLICIGHVNRLQPPQRPKAGQGARRALPASSVVWDKGDQVAPTKGL